ncbi:hypothetical protein P3T39_000397 [Kitasatospora sp. GP82]|nr:hypothetical protein [Kitasatospora sp. GP82]
MAYVLSLRPPGGPRTWTVVDCAYKTVQPVGTPMARAEVAAERVGEESSYLRPT